MTRKFFSKLLFVVLPLAVIAGWFVFSEKPVDVPQLVQIPSAEEILAEAFQNQRSGFFTSFRVYVVHVLSDDLSGAKHQRFLIRLSNGMTLLISHNIDLAKRIVALDPGDSVEVCGRYEWNEKGGVIHWTHRDPANQIPGGWIRHEGALYV